MPHPSAATSAQRRMAPPPNAPTEDGRRVRGRPAGGRSLFLSRAAPPLTWVPFPLPGDLAGEPERERWLTLRSALLSSLRLQPGRGG
jgi:hypothetical protein